MRQLVLTLALIPVALALTVFAYTVLMVTDSTANGTRDGRTYWNLNSAMAPTLLKRELFTVRVLRGKKGELLAPVHRGDVIAYQLPPDTFALAKRLVGIGGDTLSMADGVLHVNGREVREPYARRSDADVDPVPELFRWQRRYLVGNAARDTAGYRPSRHSWGPIVVPPGHYFVLGDNRDSSFDSRFSGLLPGDYVVGTARRVFLSRDPAGSIRWSRLGARVR